MRELKSDNYNPGLQGWRISADGNAEFQSGIFRGKIVASEGKIGGWNIGTDKLYGSGVLEGGTVRTAASGARIQLVNTNVLEAYDANYLRVRLDTESLKFYYNTGAGLAASLWAEESFYIQTTGELILKSIDGAVWIKDCLLVPMPTAQINLGNSNWYWNEVNAKSFTDRGCIIDIDEDEALQNLRNIKKPKKFLKSRQSEKLKTNPKYSRLDYDSFPDYAKDIPSEEEQKKGAEKGIDLSSAISMLLSVSKNLDKRLQKLEENYAKSK